MNQLENKVDVIGVGDVQWEGKPTTAISLEPKSAPVLLINYGIWPLLPNIERALRRWVGKPEIVYHWSTQVKAVFFSAFLNGNFSRAVLDAAELAVARDGKEALLFEFDGWESIFRARSLQYIKNRTL